MRFTITIKKESKWIFDTSATGGVGVGLVTGSGGLIQLKNPAGMPVKFHYGGAGVGLSAGGKLPKIPKVPKIDLKGKSGSGSTTDFTSNGAVYITEAFEGDELDTDDFRGPCIFLDGGAGLIVGYSGTAFLVGIDPIKLALAVANPVAIQLAYASAKAVVCVRGWNTGAQAGGGVSINMGYFR